MWPCASESAMYSDAKDPSPCPQDCQELPVLTPDDRYW